MKQQIVTIYLGLLTLILVIGCSETKKNVADKKTIATVTKKEKVTPNATSTLSIEGMVCKMGCGASIRKVLNDEKGVANCEIDFKEERKVNLLKINYDSTLISQQKMILLLSSINERQFKVAVH
jgi:copper chaperone CopZ